MDFPDIFKRIAELGITFSLMVAIVAYFYNEVKKLKEELKAQNTELKATNERLVDYLETDRSAAIKLAEETKIVIEHNNRLLEMLMSRSARSLQKEVLS